MTTPTPAQIAKLPKWATQYFADRLRDAELRAALCWTSKVERDAVATDYDKATAGWNFNEYSKTVDRAWSTTDSHGSGERDIRRRAFASQGPLRMFSTEALALAALRNAVERSAAEELRRIDARIASLTP